MGVLPCHRGNCAAVMCDRYSEEWGYICHSCFDELIQLGVQTDVAAFMKSDVPIDAGAKEAAAHYYFHQIFSPQ